jgi:hypothetical protein
MKFLLYTSLVLALTPQSLALTPLGVDTLFQIDFASNDLGGCNYVGQDSMQRLLKDSLNLLEVGTKLATDYGNDVEEARRLLDSFFKVASPPMTSDELSAIASE